MKRQVITWICAVTMMAALLSGCGGSGNTGGQNGDQQSDSGSETSTAAGREARREKNEVIVAIGEEPDTGFDPSTGGHGSITKVFFSTLFKRDKELGWTNDLATGYKVSDDKLTWTVTIRDDAVFTDGSKVTAGDVAFTYSSAKESGSDIDLTMIEEIQAVDNTTVEFTLNRTYSAFIERLAYLGIVPELPG